MQPSDKAMVYSQISEMTCAVGYNLTAYSDSFYVIPICSALLSHWPMDIEDSIIE